MDELTPDQEKRDYMKLFAFTLGIGMEVLHLYFEQKILNTMDFYVFLEKYKHCLFHECFPSIQCCECLQRSLVVHSKKGSLNEKQFHMLFDIGPLCKQDHYKTGRNNTIIMDCLCRIDATRSLDVDCMDITLMCAIIKSCILNNHTSIHGNPNDLETIRETRNLLAHAPGLRIPKSEFVTRMVTTEQAIISIASTMGSFSAKVQQRKIDAFKNTDLTMESMKAIIESNADEIKKNLQTLIEDQRETTMQIKDEIIEHLIKYKGKLDEMSIDIGNLRFEVKEYAVKKSDSGTQEWTFASQGAEMKATTGSSEAVVTDEDERSRKCRVEWRLETPNTWHLAKMKKSLEKFSGLLREWFEIEFVHVGSLVIHTLVTSHVVNDRDKMRKSVNSFLEKVVEVCKINRDIYSVIRVALMVYVEADAKETEVVIQCENCEEKDNIISHVSGLKEKIYEMSKTVSQVSLDSEVSEKKDDTKEVQAAIGDELVDIPHLLQWCQKALENYPNFKIKDLTTSWRSGCELGCLINVFCPHTIKIEDLDRTNVLRTMEIVVNIAKREFEIFPILTVSEMVNCSYDNEVEMASYLSQFYQLFHGEHIPTTSASDNSILSDEKKDLIVANIVKPRTTIVQIPEEKIETDENLNDICYLCKRVLFFLEKISVENVFCHRRCLKCEKCNCELNLGNYRTQKSYRGRVRFFCIKHAGPNAKLTQSIKIRPQLVGKLKRCNSDPTEERHAQRVELAARKLARQRQQNQIFITQELKRQLEEAGVELRDIEREGVDLETKLKDNNEKESKQSLRRQLCSLYTRRQKLLQYEAELRSASEHFLPSQEEEAENTCPAEYIPIVEDGNSFDEKSVASGVETFNDTMQASGVIVDDDRKYETQNATETKSDTNISGISDAVPDTTFSDTVRAETYGSLEIKDSGIMSERPCEITTDETHHANDKYKVTTKDFTFNYHIKVVTRTKSGVDSSSKMSEDNSRYEAGDGDKLPADIDKLTFVVDKAILMYWE